MALRLLRLAAKAKGRVRHYQANTERRREVLSVVVLGREVLRSEHLKLTEFELSSAATQLRNLIRARAIAA